MSWLHTTGTFIKERRFMANSRVWHEHWGKDFVERIDEVGQAMKTHGLTRLEVSLEKGGSLILERLPEGAFQASGNPAASFASFAPMASSPAQAVASPPLPTTSVGPQETATGGVIHPPADAEAGELVTSPLVGTAYLSSEPGAAPIVRVGDTVSSGQTLMVIEAMKVMNNIPSTVSGTIMEILVSDSQPVEYGQPLVRVA